MTVETQPPPIKTLVDVFTLVPCTAATGVLVLGRFVTACQDLDQNILDGLNEAIAVLQERNVLGE